MEYQELVLETTGVLDCFEGRYTTAHGEKKEPVLRQLQLEGPTVYIGDTQADLEAAERGGMPFVGALYGYAGAGFQPHFAARCPGVILACLRQIQVFYRVRERLQAGKPRVLGLSGVDASGKTRFFEDYAAFLRATGVPCRVVHLDDYHNPSSLRRRGADERDAYYRNAFDLDKLVREVLSPLRESGRLCKTVRCLDLEADQYTREVAYRIDRDTVVLVEGVLLFRPPVDEYLDARIFLDVSFDEVLRRAAVRDVPRYGPEMLERYRRKYIPVQRRYLEEWTPRERCDLLVDNEDYGFPVLIRPSQRK